MKLGIGTYTYMWSIGFPGFAPMKPMRAMDLVAQAQKLDVRVLQFGPNLPLYELPSAELQALLEACRSSDIDLEVGTRGIETRHLERLIAFTRECGVSLLRSVPELEGQVPSGKELTSALRAIRPALERARVTLALENSRVPARELEGALEDAGSEWIGVTLDTANSLAIPEGTCEVANCLARWTRCLHLKDFAIRREWHAMGFRVEGRPAGQGQLNIPWLLDLVARQGSRANAILELWPPEQQDGEQTVALEKQWAEESIRYLRTLVKE